MRELTTKQRKFAEAYLLDPHGTKAAIAAGYSARGAAVIASNLLKHPKILGFLIAAKKQGSRDSGVDSAWLLTRFAELADVNLADMVNEDGTLKALHDMPEDCKRLIAGIEVSEEFRVEKGKRVFVGWTKKVRLVDRVRLLELIGKHVDVGALRERIQTEHLVGVKIFVNTGIGGAPGSLGTAGKQSDRFKQDYARQEVLPHAAEEAVPAPEPQALAAGPEPIRPYVPPPSVPAPAPEAPDTEAEPPKPPAPKGLVWADIKTDWGDRRPGEAEIE